MNKKKLKKIVSVVVLIALIQFLLACGDPELVKKHSDGSTTYKLKMKNGESKSQVQSRMFSAIGCKDYKVSSDDVKTEKIKDANAPIGGKAKIYKVSVYTARFKCNDKKEEKKKEVKKDKKTLESTAAKRETTKNEVKFSKDPHTNLVDLEKKDLPDKLKNRSMGDGKIGPIELNRKGIAAAQKNKYTEALKYFEQASAIQDFSSAKTFNNIAYTYELKNDLPQAISHYRHALIRDPKLERSLQNIGKVYYQNKNYREAVGYGEETLALYPQNKITPKWLPDAKRKLTEQTRTRTGQSKVEEFLNKNKSGKLRKEPFFVKEFGFESPHYLYGNKSTATYNYFTQAGLLTVPANFFTLLRPSSHFAIDIQMGTPWFGAANPGFLAGEQKIEFLYRFSDIYFGLGALFTQANFSFDVLPGVAKKEFISNADFPQSSDTKFGLIFGANTANGDIRLAIYSRYLFRDFTDASRSTAFDRNLIDFYYAYRFDSVINMNGKKYGWPWKFYFKLHMDEIFITEYKNPTNNKNISHYFATYDLTLFGINYGQLKIDGGKNEFTLGFEYGIRLYFRDLENTSPESYGPNGQGWFGFSPAKSLEGNPFPGFKGNSHVLTFYSTQSLWNRLKFEERIGYEITLPSEANHVMFASIKVIYMFETNTK